MQVHKGGQDCKFLEYNLQEKGQSVQQLAEQQKQLMRKNEGEYSKCVELKALIQDNNKRINELESQINIYQKDLEGVRYSNGSVLERNDEL